MFFFFNCSCVQTDMMSQTLCQPTLHSEGEALSLSTSSVPLYRLDEFPALMAKLYALSEVRLSFSVAYD